MFDPLHKWLGIPPDQQPPNHYRLLGIDPFEADLDVIDAAADKQMTFLHQLTGGEHAEAAEDISNQVSIARLCLLNPDKKGIYDSSLKRAQQEAQPSFSPIQASAAGPSTHRKQPRRTVRPQSRSSQSRSSWGKVSAIFGIVILLMLVLGIQQGRLIIDWSRYFPNQSASNPISSTKAGAPGPVSRPSSKPASSPSVLENPGQKKSQPVVPPQRTDDTAPSKNQSEQAPSQASTTEPATKQPPMPRGSLADLLHDTKSEQANTNDSAAEEPMQKTPIPNKVALADKMALVRDLYQDQYVNAKSSEQRIQLARQMHRDGELTTDDPVGRFALWQVSRDIFAGQGRFNAAIAIADNLSTFYSDVDTESLKLESLKKSSAKIASSDLNDFYDTSMQFAGTCCDHNRHVVATDTIVFMLQTFGDRLDFSKLEKAKLVRDQAAAEGQQYRDFKQAIATLAKNPDSNASETVGRYLAFVRADWNEAVHYLAKSPVESLSVAGKLQIAHQSDDSKAIEVADAWYAASDKIEDAVNKTKVMRHAAKFYATAIANSDGLAKRKAETRIAKINGSIGKPPESDPIDSTASEASNVAAEVLGYRVYNSSDSKSDFAKHRRNQFSIGMGNRSGGMGEAAVGVELKSVESIEVTGSASHDTMLDVDAFSKTGFIIDYHTPGGYTKRVFLGLGINPGREFTRAPAWGNGDKPETVTDIGKSSEYKIDLTRWAPPTWDGRSWVTLYMQNAGEGRSIEAEMKW